MPHWDPIRDLMLLQDRMNQLFEDATQRRAREREQSGGDQIQRADWIPLADVHEDTDNYFVSLDVPGVDRNALEIDLENERLVIKGTRTISRDDSSSHRTERPHGTFNRSFAVPSGVDREQIEAEYKDGVLNLRLPKRKQQRPQPVKIKVT
jgi:HSP20 family protein